MPAILEGQLTGDTYGASEANGCEFKPDKNTQQVVFSGQGGDFYVKVYVKTGGTHAGVWDGAERLYLDGSGDNFNANCAGVQFRSATPGVPVAIYGAQAFPGDVISAAPAFGGGPSAPFSTGLDVTDGVTDVFPTTEIFIGPGLTLTMLAAGVAELQGASSLVTTDGVTTVSPTTELLIGTGLVLSEPSAGIAELVASIGVGPWYYATPVAPASAPSGGIASSAFQGSVVNAQQPDGSYDPLRWRLVGESVEFAGTIGNVIPGALILTLPLAFRPVYDTEASIVSADGSSSFSVGVSTTGAVTLLAVTGTGSGSTPGGPASGDLSGSYPGPVVSAINGSPLGSTGGASSGQALAWNGSAWVPTTITPGGSAGGDLSGTYPNPTVAKVNGSPLGTTTGASSGQGLLWNGSAWAAASITDTDLSLSDNTNNNVSTSAHGFAPKLPNSASLYLDGTGNYTTPPGTQTGVISKIYRNKPAGSITRASSTIGSFSTAWQITGVVVASGQNVILQVCSAFSDAGANKDHIVAFVRGSTLIASWIVNSPPAFIPGTFTWIDENPGAGTYTYEVQAAIFGGATLTVFQSNPTTDAGGGASVFVAEVYNP